MRGRSAEAGCDLIDGEFPVDFENSPPTSLVVLQQDKVMATIFLISYGDDLWLGEI
jgi:hypothetical protein